MSLFTDLLFVLVGGIVKKYLNRIISCGDCRLLLWKI